MMRGLVLIAAAIILPGCSVAKPVGPLVDAPQTQVAAPAAPTTMVTSPVSLVSPAAEKCDAAQLSWLVGRSRNEIPVPVDPSRRRVACTRCPVTEDYRADRTTIRYDAQSGLVTSVKCG